MATCVLVVQKSASFSTGLNIFDSTFDFFSLEPSFSLVLLESETAEVNSEFHDALEEIGGKK